VLIHFPQQKATTHLKKPQTIVIGKIKIYNYINNSIHLSRAVARVLARLTHPATIFNFKDRCSLQPIGKDKLSNRPLSFYGKEFFYY
jgi:hypothetical protein